jgi:DnaA family protein
MRQIALDIGLAHPPALDRYLAGPNAAALEHLRLWTADATRSPVPTYLWGGSGSGKSYLLEAVREALRSQGGSVGWLSPGAAEPPAFDERWAAVLIDDAERMDSAQQQAAFNWFVNAQTHQRWVLAAGALPPADLPLRDDLRTRLGWGHVFQLQPLSEAECRAVLRQEADARGVFLSDEVMDFMLSRFARDLGHLVSLLDRLDGYALATQRGITIPLLKDMLAADAA